MILTSIVFSIIAFLVSKVAYPDLRNWWYYLILGIGLSHLILGIVYVFFKMDSRASETLIGFSFPVLCFVAGHFFWKKRKIK